MVSFILILSLLFSLERAQTECRVLLDDISTEYYGECKNDLAHGLGRASGADEYFGNFKKGLPHGRGEYKWANGDSYKGMWSKGYRHGRGTFKFTWQGKDSVLFGQWNNGRFLIPPERIYEIRQNNSIDNVQVRKMGEGGDEIYFEFRSPRGRTSVQDLLIISTSGTVSTGAQTSNIVSEVHFPVTIKITYSTPTAMTTSVLRCVLDFTIFEPGRYKVILRTQ